MTSATSDPKAAALGRLAQWARINEQRDSLVCGARRAGATQAEIVATSKLAKQTVVNILHAAGLTGEALKQKQEQAVQTAAIDAQHFPHHPHFIAAEKSGNRTKYTFHPFTGDEPEPQHPDFPKPYEAQEKQSPADKAMWAEYIERESEIEAARKVWMEARYYREITPLVEAAVKARPPVDEALAEMTTAWESLDNALVWPVAVKQLIDAQDKARRVLGEWVRKFAYPLAKAEGSQPHYICENVANWSGIAEKITGERIGWEVGWYYQGDRHCPASYSDDPRDGLDRTIREQRDRLKEIAELAGTRDEGN